ncbi:unnamed protein product [Rotaria magnacalcarata]|uniref:F-box domain-containing protein n=1 Tax=Rotaria magnacalcarata TaxID=392030 RepID=A0A820F079_9BILA|nr:unnamed protein product [Rotaria magnacalcarata]CAF2133735.1 unnamed protein product [Rotaria magnacalcarata]CAF4250136.1 unnamed protein product [Rotaria magnacalcarata]CAF4254461.1 unnamed protein product [Rotaria magnacalcarata]
MSSSPSSPSSTSSLLNLPWEVIYLIFQYLNKEDIAYAFFGLNQCYRSAVKYFIGPELNLAKVNDENTFGFCLSTLLPCIGFNLRYLSIGYPHALSKYIKYIQNYCSNLDILNIYCYSNIEDIRCYAAYLIHRQLMSFTLMYNNKIVGEDLSIRLINKCENEKYRAIPSISFLIFNLSSMNDLILLKRFSESSYVPDGLYMIECLSTGDWLTDGKDDLCTMSKKLHRDSIFSIKQIDSDQCSREYELYNEGTQRRLTVLILYEEEGERWISSSILSAHRKESSQSCSRFTFERVANDNQFYIRPCYTNAKRLQVSGKRIIVSLCDNQNTLGHRFKLNHIS